MLRFVRGIRNALLFLIVVALPVSTGAAAGDEAGLQRVERLVVRYHAGGFELMSRTAVQKVIPPMLRFADSTARMSGSWFELQTSAGGVLYRRLMPPPQIVYVEMPADSTSGKIIRQEATVSDRTFVVTVPVRSDAVQVAFYGQPAGSVGKQESSQLVGTIRIR